jgi:NodT family efflux transporter outer membrane factor (OMF) lipoprotein
MQHHSMQQIRAVPCSGLLSTAGMLIFCCMALSLTGCSVHTVDPNPEPPLAVQPVFPSTTEIQDFKEPTTEAWWMAFSDPQLNELIKRGFAQNYSIQEAVARLDQARALTVQSRAARLPQVDIVGESGQRWFEGGEERRLNRAGVEFTWEVDIFDRLGSQALARQSEQQARREEVEAVRLRLSAEIAEAYFDAVGWHLQLALLNNQIATDLDLLELTQLRFDSGLTASVDVLQQSSQLAEAQSLVPPVEGALRVSENRLDVLLGESPDGRDRVPASSSFVDIGALPFVGVPADLLLDRPDLRALRSELVAADAEIGAAIADRFPQITLDGSFLYEDGLEPGGVVFSLVGTFIQPLIDWGARKAEVERNQALYVERLARFTQTFLEAVEDVENSLYLERQQREFLKRLERRRAFLEETLEKTTERYTGGLTDFLPVLAAVNELQRLERIIVQQERALLSFRIQLHRALGGSLGSEQT